MDASQTNFLESRRRPRWWVIALVVLGHLLALYGLVRAFAPNAVASVERSVLATFNVTITAPPPPPPPAAEPEPDEGAAGEQGKQAVPKPVTAPKPKVTSKPTPVPRASSTGSASTSGAEDSGAGTGASGTGAGTGSGNGGAGQGGGAVTKVSVRSGSIDEARDFPIPAGGRGGRAGTSVTVAFTVGIDGRASNCTVIRPGPDAQTNALLCALVVERVRFNPARNARGEPVPARYGWKQDFFRQR